MALVALVSWVITAVVGVLALVQWRRRRRRQSPFPTRLVAGHVGAVTLGLALWTAYVVSGQLWTAWLTFVVVNAANALGDTILLGRFRAVAGLGGSWARDYRRALGAVLKGKYPPLRSLHGILGGVTFVATLAACVVGTWG